MDFSNGWFIGIFILVAAAVIYWFILKPTLGDKPKEKSIDTRVRDIDDRRVTGRGLHLWVDDGVDMTSDKISAIEEGLIECFAKTVAKGINIDKDGNEIKDAPLDLKDYIVVVFGDTMRAPSSGEWCYRVHAENYRGTDFDLADGVIDGKILAAGQMLNDVSANYIIVADPGPEPTEQDMLNLRRISMYEAEHVILRKCDYQRFLDTSTHGVGDGHPLY